VDWTGWVGIGLGAGGVVILAWTALTRTPGGGGWTFAAYEAGWREAHQLGEEARPGGRLAAWYLRLPYALGAPLARAGVDPDLVTLGALWVGLVAGWVAAGTAAAGLLLLLEYVRARAQAARVASAWTLATPGERPTRVIVLGLAGLAVGAAQLGGPGLARAALDLGYPLALAALAVLEAAGCAQLLLAVRHAGARLR
jgi:hypothetical protein